MVKMGVLPYNLGGVSIHLRGVLGIFGVLPFQFRREITKKSTPSYQKLSSKLQNFNGGDYNEFPAQMRPSAKKCQIIKTCTLHQGTRQFLKFENPTRND